jgi:hypothetical protein
MCEASCDCRAPYLPAGERAAQAVAANPERSNRALANEIGVDDKTIAKARAEYSATGNARAEYFATGERAEYSAPGDQFDKR